MAKMNDEDQAAANRMGLTQVERDALADDVDDETILREIAGDEGDDEGDDAPADAAPAPQASTASEATTDASTTPDKTTTEATSAEADAESVQSVEAPFTPLLQGPQIDDYETQRGELLDARKQLRADHRSGELGADEYDERLDKLNDQLAQLDQLKLQADLTARYNQDMQRQSWLATVNAFKREVARVEKIDYDANPGLMNMWDAEVKRLGSDPANTDKSWDYFLRTAHTAVLDQVRATAKALGLKEGDVPLINNDGKTPAVPDSSKKAMADASKARQPDLSKAKSLAQAPNASSDAEKGESAEFAHLESLNGMALERAVAKLSKEAQQRWAELN